MRIRVEGPGGTRDWQVETTADATLGDLIAATNGVAAVGARVDGRWWPARAALPDTACVEGSLVQVAASADTREAASNADPTAGARLGLIAGPDAGRWIPLPEGTTVIGRATIADPYLSRRHAAVTVAVDGARRVDDLGSTNGVDVDGVRVRGATIFDVGAVLRLGSTLATVDDALATRGADCDARDHAAPGGRIPVHRPPRAATPGDPPLPEAPLPPDPGASPRLVAAAVVVPLVTGLVLAAVHGLALALLTLIGPAVTVAVWAGARRRAGRHARRGKRAWRAAVARFTVDAAQVRTQAGARHRARYPDLPTIVDIAQRRGPRTWERRQGDEDFLQLVVGPGEVAWPSTPPPDAHPDLTGALTALGPNRHAPVVLDAAGLVGIVGPRRAIVPLARALVVQAASLHGPADLRIGVLTSTSAARDWDWAAWLPHTIGAHGDSTRVVAHGSGAVDDLLAAEDGAHQSDDPIDWWVVDGDDESLARGGAVRALLSGRRGGAVAGIVLAPNSDRLPAACRTIVEISANGFEARIMRLDVHEAARRASPAGLTIETATLTARRLARLEDPDTGAAGRRLPAHAALVDLLELAVVDACAVQARWATRGTVASLPVPIGLDDNGTFEIDLVHDGPHALVAGTTGSGKSELLRSLVAALAATFDTETCSLVLVDFKGGAAFDKLASLPHVVGMITDLDERLAARALRCLDAELRRREKMLREAAVSDLRQYVRARRHDPTLEPLPRLVVVIDEFATLVAELPDFVDSLVDIAQRGRSLGVHLVLATQRPAGVLKDSIRTNTNLRISLRVVDVSDSRDVIGVDTAAHLSRSLPGRAYARVGPSELVAFQAAHVSGTTTARVRQRVVAEPWEPGVPQHPIITAVADASSDLERLVAAIEGAHEASGHRAPRRPWPELLPLSVTLDELDPTDPYAFGLIDAPESQCHRVLRWEPSTGNLLVAGLAGSGVTTALGTLGLRFAGASPAAAAHVYVITSDPTALAALEPLPSVGAVIAVDDDERVARLLRTIDRELRERRSDRRPRPPIITLIDGVGSLRAELDAGLGRDDIEVLERIAADGPALGLHLVLGAEHPSAVGHRLDRTVVHRVLLRLPEAADYAQAGIRGADPAQLPPGRGFWSATGHEVQLAWSGTGGLAAAAARARAAATTTHAAPPIGTLPRRVERDDLRATAAADAGGIRIPIGVGDRSLTPVAIHLRPGDHVLVAGPARSGKSAALALIAHVARDVPKLRMETIRSSRAARAAASRDVLGALVDSVLEHAGPVLVLVDDADLLDDGGVLTALVSPGRPDVHVVASGRGDRFRGLFRHWTSEVRRSQLGVLLRADDTDGELLGARLPRHPLVPWVPGRGWLVQDGLTELCQLAAPPSGDDEEGARCA
jgi:S-DNA-T family DNA segregation ATPase FtsK/SpoIIIE